MLLKQYYLGCLAHASYLIADERTKTAAVVDPQRDIAQYLADARAGGYDLRYVFLTHFHADFLAGHIELRNQAGARICMGRRAQAEFEHTALQDGDMIEFGDVRIQCLETPGHTPEGISLLVFDTLQSQVVPYAVLTGDTLFIGDVGRPDLLASIGVTADELAEMLYNSLDKLRRLPDSTLVYPAHGAGSLCGKSLSKETVSTIGEQKADNYALQPMPFEQFRELVTSELPEGVITSGTDAGRSSAPASVWCTAAGCAGSHRVCRCSPGGRFEYWLDGKIRHLVWHDAETRCTDCGDW
jgi:hydroxyacylglutathione hydrolase